MNIKRIKLFAVGAIFIPLLALAIFSVDPVSAVSGSPVNTADDVADSYKKTCAMCHKATAEKFFDPAKMDEVLVEVVLKGKKAEKPPHMPGYEEKGMTKDQAKLLVSYMRQMRTPPSQ
jgi:hypothetical protein